MSPIGDQPLEAVCLITRQHSCLESANGLTIHLPFFFYILLYSSIVIRAALHFLMKIFNCLKKTLNVKTVTNTIHTLSTIKNYPKQSKIFFTEHVQFLQHKCKFIQKVEIRSDDGITMCYSMGVALNIYYKL